MSKSRPGLYVMVFLILLHSCAHDSTRGAKSTCKPSTEVPAK